VGENLHENPRDISSRGGNKFSVCGIRATAKDPPPPSPSCPLSFPPCCPLFSQAYPDIYPSLRDHATAASTRSIGTRVFALIAIHREARMSRPWEHRDRAGVLTSPPPRARAREGDFHTSRERSSNICVSISNRRGFAVRNS